MSAVETFPRVATRWGIVVTQIHQQEKFIEQLVSAGLSYFFPQVSEVVRRRGRRVHRLYPFLFNYLPVVLGGDWERVYGFKGFVDLLAPVRDVEIEKLKARCTADGILFQPVEPRFKAGQLVRPKRGPLIDSIGTYVGELRDEREVALFNILGARRSIKFAVGDLVAA